MDKLWISIMYVKSTQIIKFFCYKDLGIMGEDICRNPKWWTKLQTGVDMRNKQTEEFETNTVKHRKLFRGNQKILNWFINHIQNTIKVIRKENKMNKNCLFLLERRCLKLFWLNLCTTFNSEYNVTIMYMFTKS